MAFALYVGKFVPIDGWMDSTWPQMGFEQFVPVIEVVGSLVNEQLAPTSLVGVLKCEDKDSL